MLEEKRNYYDPMGNIIKEEYRNLITPFKKEQKIKYLLLVC